MAVTSAPVAGQFNLFVREVATVSGVQQVVASEAFRNLSNDPASSRNALAVVNAGSLLLRLSDPVAEAAPTAASADPQRRGPGGRLCQSDWRHGRQPPDANALIGNEAQKTGSSPSTASSRSSSTCWPSRRARFSTASYSNVLSRGRATARRAGPS